VAKYFTGLFRAKEVDKPNPGSLYFEMGTATFTTTGQTVAVDTSLTTIVGGVVSPFHTATQNANDVCGVDSDSLSSGSFNIVRPASGTSALVVNYIVWGYIVATS